MWISQISLASLENGNLASIAGDKVSSIGDSREEYVNRVHEIRVRK